MGHQKLPRQVAGRVVCAMRFRGEEDVNTWDIWVARRMMAQIWERIVCSMIVGGLGNVDLVGLEVER